MAISGSMDAGDSRKASAARFRRPTFWYSSRIRAALSIRLSFGRRACMPNATGVGARAIPWAEREHTAEPKSALKQLALCLALALWIAPALLRGATSLCQKLPVVHHCARDFIVAGFCADIVTRFFP
jgi:hypothetical protein